MECPICVELFDGNKITCSYCQFESCKSCAGRFILDSMNEPSCMNCRHVWYREYVMDNFDKKWVNYEFLPHIGILLREQEKLLLPDTQHEASLVSQIKDLSKQLQDLPTNKQLERKYKNKPILLTEHMNNKKSERSYLLTSIHDLKTQTITFSGKNVRKTHQIKKTYIFRCPYDECRGFVCTDFHCGICQREVCEKCHSPYLENHKCNADDIRTASLVMHETKPCPKCMTLIYKASGCNQMYCTQCHTAFDWVTGKIETGAIHNPHFYEYLAANNLNIHNIENLACGELPDIYSFSQYIRSINITSEYIKRLMDIYRIIEHIEAVVLPNYRLDRIKDNFDLRVQFLNQEFDEETWGMKLMNREKKRMKIKATRELLEMVQTIMKDFIRQVIANQNVYDVISQFNKLKEYYQESLDNIVRIHGGKIVKELLVLK